MQDGKMKIPIQFWAQRSRSHTDLCKHFSSDIITYLVFDIQISYFIHRCRMAREDIYTFCGQKVNEQIHNQHFSSLTITEIVFSKQLSYFMHINMDV